MSHKREIEHKFLVDPTQLPPLPAGRRLRQGYFSFQPAVRVRSDEGVERKGYITIKGEGDFNRDEFEYEIPFEEATALLELCKGSIVEKTRYRLPVDSDCDLAWELDIFEGDNQGLVVVELEIPDEGCAFARPDWLGQDVTRDSSYKNSSLAEHPYSTWDK